MLIKKQLISKIIKIFEKKFFDEIISEKNIKSQSVLDILIATKLSQNTTDKTAFIAYNNLKRKFHSWEELMNGSLKEIKKEIKVCGMANTKAKDIKSILKSIHNKYNTFDLSFFSNLPTDEVYKNLLQLKGIGIKTASCVLAFALDRDVFPVDTHIHRILNRLGLVKTNTPEKTFLEISNKIPQGKKLFLHKSLIRFGRNICKAKNPLCSKCFLFVYCKYEHKQKNSKIEKKVINKEKNFLILENI